MQRRGGKTSGNVLGEPMEFAPITHSSIKNGKAGRLDGLNKIEDVRICGQWPMENDINRAL